MHLQMFVIDQCFKVFFNGISHPNIYPEIPKNYSVLDKLSTTVIVFIVGRRTIKIKQSESGIKAKKPVKSIFYRLLKVFVC